MSKPIVPDKLESMIQKMLPEELLHETVEKTEGPSKDASAFCLEELPVVEGLDWNYAWLHLPEEELLAEANKWELGHGGLSGRTAQQFVDYLAGMEE